MINSQLNYLLAQQHLADARAAAQRERIARSIPRAVPTRGRPRRRLAACVAAAVVGVLVVASPAWAAGRTLYVSASATADPSCAAASASNPFATVSGALACAGNGSTIVVGKGTFAGGFTISRNVTVRGAGSGTVIANPGATALSLTEVTVGSGHSVTLEDLTVNGEDETDVMASSGSLTITHSLIENGVGTTGGDVVMTPGSGTAKLSILDSTISGGTGLGASAGGLDIADATQSSPSRTTIVNSTIADNQGGGIALGAWDALTVRDSTISGNQSGAGSAGAGLSVVHGAPGVSPVSLTNTILAGNIAGQDPDCEDDQGITDGGHNVLGDQGTDCAGMTDGTNGDQVGTDSAPLNPELGPLADNGGLTPTMAPLSGSPAIGAGDPADCEAKPVGDADQRGHTRNAPGRLACDVGADDTGGVPLRTLYVSHAASSDPACASASKTSPFATLSGALSCAGSGTLIKLGAGSFTAGVTIPGNVILQGAGPHTVILGTGTDPEAVPTITVPDDRFLTIRSLTVNGDNSQAGLTMGTGAVNLIDSTVTNAFGPHGAIGVLPPSGTAILNLLRSTVANNDSSGVGGAIEAVDSGSTEGSATINLTDSTVADNQGGQDGGGVYLYGRHTLNVRDSTIAGNQVSNDGGGIYGWGTFAKVTLTDSIVAANGAQTGPDCYDPAGLTDGGHNLLGTGDANCTGLTDGVDGDHVGSDSSPLGPDLGALAGNGGPTQTMALQPGSPAIGAGSAADCKAAPVSDTDQRGESRNAMARGTCDIGAYDTGGAAS